MPKAEDENQARLERARAIGLFRYMLIREAADPGLSSRQRGTLVRKIAAQEHTDPSGRRVRLTRWTLDRWIAGWRAGGFDALVPSPRQSHPRTPDGARPRSPSVLSGVPHLVGPLEYLVDHGSSRVSPAWRAGGATVAAAGGTSQATMATGWRQCGQAGTAAGVVSLLFPRGSSAGL